MALTPDQFTIYGTIGTLIALIIIIYFTHATRRRIAGALVGGLVVGLLSIFIDFIASSLGFWYYPGSTTGYAPLGYYIPVILFYGAGIALIGWRINRRFGIKGLAVFIILFGIYGSTRDYVTAATASKGIITSAPGIVPVIADYLAGICILTVAQIVMWLVAGSSKEVSLART